ncbi:hypothetical protein CY34DRAFT_80436, partial [Suillus luteus UH-Slu-Lm8-n1]
NFIPQLKDHLLARLRGIEYSGDKHNFTDEDRDQILFANNKLHEHGILQVNYTTYDLRREQDTINPRTRADIMVLSHEDDEERHPYWYARVVRIFHLDVWYYGGENAVASKPLRMHVLFVCWFGRDVSFKGGWSAKHLHRLGFLKGDDPTCFVFLDPDQVIRGVHLIPVFAHDRVTDHYMGPSFVRREQDGNKDWCYHYVNMYVPLYI